MVNRYVIGTKIVLLGFDSASESHQSPVPSFRRSKACPVPRYGAGIQRGRVAPTTPKHFQRPGPIFIPWCAGTSRHGRLVRKHVPDSDPGSFPAPAGDTNHRRPNNDSPGSQERNVALGLVPSQGWGGGHRRHLTLPSTNAPHFHTLVCRCQPAWATAMKTDDTRHSQHHNPHQTRHWYENAPTRLSSAPLNPSIPRSRHSGPSIRHSREGGNPGEAYGWQMTRTQLLQSAPRFSYLGVPAPAGISDCYENMSRTTIRDRLPTRHSGESRSPGVGNPVAPELLSSQGSPTRRDFHPLMRPSQGHGDSGESTSRTPIRGRNPEGQGKGKTMAILAIDAVWALRLRQLAELARPYTKTTQRRGQT